MSEDALPNFSSDVGDYWLDLDVSSNDSVLHRIDGPTLRYPNGSYEWYLKGFCYASFDEWLKDNHYVTDEEKIMLKLRYGD